MNSEKSQALFERAQQHIVAGVNSPVRAYRAVGGDPPFIASASGSSITGGEGNVVSGTRASISGGFQRSATDQYDWAAGSLLEDE